jgi:hypothetical protein
MENETTTPNPNQEPVITTINIEVPKRNEKGQLLPGYTANLKGRPKKKRFEDYFTEEEKLDLINKLKSSTKEDIWYKLAEMLFGKPKLSITGGDEDDNPISILTNVFSNNSVKQDTETNETD